MVKSPPPTIDDRLLDLGPDGPQLFGARRKRDGSIVFPAPDDTDEFDRVPLSNRGVLWSYTIQSFRPTSPPYAGADDDQSFVPFALGYVELPGEVIVEARLNVTDFSALRIGMPMALETYEFQRAGGPVLSFAFGPVAQ